MHEPEAPLEVDVAGPLTLEEAKAVGDVPQTYDAKEKQSEGLLQRATHLFLGDPKEDEQHVQGSSTPEEGNPSAAAGSEALPADVAKDDLEATDPEHERKVTFAEDAKEGDANAEAAAHHKDEKKEKKKSFFKFLSKKKDEDDGSHEAHETHEPHEASHEPAAATTAAQDAEMATPAAAEESPLADQHAEPTEDAAAEEKPKKKHFLSGIFRRKDKEEDAKEELAAEPVGGAADQGDIHPEAAPAEKSEAPQPSAEPTGELASSSPETHEAAPDAAATETPRQERKKSLFGGLFGKKKHDSLKEEPAPEKSEVGGGEVSPATGEASQAAPAAESSAAPLAEEPAGGAGSAHDEGERQGFFDKLHTGAPETSGEASAAGHGEETAASATGAAAMGMGAGAGAGALIASSHNEEPADKAAGEEAVPQEGSAAAATVVPETESSKAQAADEGKKEEKQGWWHCRKEQPQPAQDAEVVKSGAVQKKGAIFGWNRIRHCRITSDGIFQWSKTGDYSMAKGLKLRGDMKVKSMDVQASFPHTLRVYVGDSSPLILVFKERGDRDSWLEVFHDMKNRLSAAQPDDGQAQVLKTSNVEREAAGTGEVPMPAAAGGDQRGAEM